MKESQMCAEIMQWARLNERRWPCLQWLRHWPNEGKRNPWEAKKIGIMAGPSDYFLPVPTDRYHGLWLEVKTKGKKPTEAQARWLVGMQELGYMAEYVDDLQSAFFILETYCREATECLNRSNPTG